MLWNVRINIVFDIRAWNSWIKNVQTISCTSHFNKYVLLFSFWKLRNNIPNGRKLKNNNTFITINITLFEAFIELDRLCIKWTDCVYRKTKKLENVLKRIIDIKVNKDQTVSFCYLVQYAADSLYSKLLIYTLLWMKKCVNYFFLFPTMHPNEPFSNSFSNNVSLNLHYSKADRHLSLVHLNSTCNYNANC